jgi:hypothetical protein
MFDFLLKNKIAKLEREITFYRKSFEYAVKQIAKKCGIHIKGSYLEIGDWVFLDCCWHEIIKGEDCEKTILLKFTDGGISRTTADIIDEKVYVKFDLMNLNMK